MGQDHLLRRPWQEQAYARFVHTFRDIVWNITAYGRVRKYLKVGGCIQFPRSLYSRREGDIRMGFGGLTGWILTPRHGPIL